MSARKNLTFLIVGLVAVAAIFVSVLVGDSAQKQVETQAHSDNLSLTKQSITINSRSFEVEVAETQAQRTKGLGGRSGLDKNNGMLFVFDTASDYCFWMKDVLFPIDILWFDDDQKLVHKVSPALPESYPKRFCPPVAARYVVELGAGASEKLETGATLEL